jgi:hypothetical protein
MPVDDRLRAGLRKIAEEVDLDVEAGLERTLAARRPSKVRPATTLLAYTAAIGLGIAIVGVGASSMLNRTGTNPSPTPSPVASAETCPKPGKGSCVTVLEPGRHQSAEFIPPVTYTIPAEAPIAWDIPEDLPGTFTIHPAGPETDAIFLFRDVRVLAEGCNPVVDESVGNTAAEIAAWLTSNPGIVSTPVDPVTRGGLRGVVLDIAASGTYTTVCPGDGRDTYAPSLPILPLFVGAGSGDLTWFIGGDEEMRLYLLDMPGGGNVVISIDAIGGDFQTLLEVTEPVVDSIRFDENYY